MIKVEETTQGVLDKISEGFEQKGAYNLRQNGISVCHGDSEHIKIRKKEDKPGIDIFIDGKTQGEKKERTPARKTVDEKTIWFITYSVY